MNQTSYRNQWHRAFWTEIWIMKVLSSSLENFVKCTIYEQANWKELKRTISLCHLTSWNLQAVKVT